MFLKSGTILLRFMPTKNIPEGGGEMAVVVKTLRGSVILSMYPLPAILSLAVS